MQGLRTASTGAASQQVVNEHRRLRSVAVR
jgi:hypothetical protein